MQTIDNYDEEGHGITVSILDYDGSKYTYTYIVDINGYAYKEGEGEYFTSSPVSPLELPAKILTFIVDNYFEKG